MKPEPIPRDIDKPPMILAWDFMEFVVYAAIFTTGIIIKQLLLSVLMIWLVHKGMRRLDQGMDGALAHWFFWNGLSRIQVKQPIIEWLINLFKGEKQLPYDGMKRVKRT